MRLRMYMLYNMIFKIINQISSEKKARNIEPTHALFKEVLEQAKFHQYRELKGIYAHSNEIFVTLILF